MPSDSTNQDLPSTDSEQLSHPTSHTLLCSTVAVMSTLTICLLCHSCKSKSVRDWKFQKILANYKGTWFSAFKGMKCKIVYSFRRESKNYNLRTNNKKSCHEITVLLPLIDRYKCQKLGRIHNFPKIMLSSLVSINNNAGCELFESNFRG